jgi:hypothetical protein
MQGNEKPDKAEAEPSEVASEGVDDEDEDGDGVLTRLQSTADAIQVNLNP